MPAERVQKLIAQAGLASRRGAEALISAGRVTINGRPASLGDRADPANDAVAVDGRPLPSAAATTHIALHKPRGVVSSTRAERGRPSVLSLVQTRAPIRLWPAGRLDVDSEGLMILTDDGPWAQRVLHPRYGLEREYAVLVAERPTATDLRRLMDGVLLEDGPARLFDAKRGAPPGEVTPEADETGTWLRVTLGEGRKREVRRLFRAIGHRVLRLVRVRIGPLSLDGLAPGAWRTLAADEVAALAGDAPRAVPAATRRLTVAIDGTSGSGKSTIGQALAQRLKAAFIDTGRLYRALTLAGLERGIDPDDGPALAALAQQVKIRTRGENVLLDGTDVTDQLRAPRIDRAVSSVSRHAAVRAAMLPVQRAAARRRSTVMVGRDIGTVVLPDATLKVFLTASTQVRAERRAAQMGRADRIERYLAEIVERDAADMNRPVAPLRKAPDALVLDTGELDVGQCVSAILSRLGRR